MVGANKEEVAIPFLDTIVKPEIDSKLSVTVYKKPTHRRPILTVEQPP